MHVTVVKYSPHENSGNDTSPHKELTFPMLRLLSSKAQGHKIFENDLNPVVLVFIGKLSLSTL